MSRINPLAAAFAQTNSVQRAAYSARETDSRRAAALRAKWAAVRDQSEHGVATTDTVVLADHEGGGNGQQQPHDEREHHAAEDQTQPSQDDGGLDLQA
jgi:hypothetical protein